MEVITLPVGPLLTNCYLVVADDKSTVIVDPGDDGLDIGAKIDQLGLAPWGIVLTHGHFDHIGAVNQLRDRYKIPVIGSPLDQELFEDIKRNRARYIHGDPEQYRVEVDPIGDGEAIDFGGVSMTAIGTPGHTRGGMCYLCGDYLLTGDTLFQGTVGRCDLYGGDYGALLASLKKLAAAAEVLGKGKDYRVLPGHGPATTLAQEIASNPYFNQ